MILLEYKFKTKGTWFEKVFSIWFTRKKCNIMKCLSQYIRMMSLKMRWARIWATFGIQTLRDWRKSCRRVFWSLSGSLVLWWWCRLGMWSGVLKVLLWYQGTVWFRAWGLCWRDRKYPGGLSLSEHFLWKEEWFGPGARKPLGYPSPDWSGECFELW